jgi:hypothetical protein
MHYGGEPHFVAEPQIFSLGPKSRTMERQRGASCAPPQIDVIVLLLHEIAMDSIAILQVLYRGLLHYLTMLLEADSHFFGKLRIVRCKCRTEPRREDQSDKQFR